MVLVSTLYYDPDTASFRRAENLRSSYTAFVWTSSTSLAFLAPSTSAEYTSGLHLFHSARGTKFKTKHRNMNETKRNKANRNAAK